MLDKQMPRIEVWKPEIPLGHRMRNVEAVNRFTSMKLMQEHSRRNDEQIRRQRCRFLIHDNEIGFFEGGSVNPRPCMRNTRSSSEFCAGRLKQPTPIAVDVDERLTVPPSAVANKMGNVPKKKPMTMRRLAKKRNELFFGEFLPLC